MSFSFNPYSKEDFNNQYFQNLQNQNYVSQIVNSIQDQNNFNKKLNSFQSEEIKKTINLLSEEQSDAVFIASQAICNKLENEFLSLNDNLEQLRFDVKELSRTIRVGSQMIVEQLKITNNLLGEIKSLLKIPDSQKQRVYHINEGLKYLYNANNQTIESDFYTDSLDEFKKAVQIESKDYFSLYYIGFIFLKSKKHFDPQEAEKYFRNSARYYLSESFYGREFANSILIPEEDYILEATFALLYAAEACYLQNKIDDAASLAKEAWTVSPSFSKAGFYQAKYLAASNKVPEAVSILEQVIKVDHQIYISVFSDLDLISKSEIVLCLEKIKNNTLKVALEIINECKNTMIEGSIGNTELIEIDQLILKNNFLDYKMAVNLLTKENDRVFSDISKNNFKTPFNPYIEFNNIEVLKKFLKGDDNFDKYTFQKERNSIYIEKLNQIFELLGKKTPWLFTPKYFDYKSDFGYIIKIIESVEINPKNIQSNILDFLKNEKIYFENLSDSKNYYFEAIKNIIEEESSIINNAIIRSQKLKSDIKRAQISFRNRNLIIILMGIGLGYLCFLKLPYLAYIVLLPFFGLSSLAFGKYAVINKRIAVILGFTIGILGGIISQYLMVKY